MNEQNRQDDSAFVAQVATSNAPSSPNMPNFFFRILGSRTAIVAIICISVIGCFYLFLNKNPSGVSLVNINVTVGNGNGDNNSGTSFGEQDAIASEQSKETEQPNETHLPKETGQQVKCNETRYYVTPYVGLWLRKYPSTESDKLRLLQYRTEVISEGCADERGWMPVRVEQPNHTYYGYVFSAYLDPVIDW